MLSTCNLTRSPEGEFLSAVVFWPEGDFCRRGVLAGGGFLLEGVFGRRGVFAKGGVLARGGFSPEVGFAQYRPVKFALKRFTRN